MFKVISVDDSDITNEEREALPSFPDWPSVVKAFGTQAKYTITIRHPLGANLVLTYQTEDNA
jgi:hypothetical protein